MPVRLNKHLLPQDVHPAVSAPGKEALHTHETRALPDVPKGSEHVSQKNNWPPDCHLTSSRMQRPRGPRGQPADPQKSALPNAKAPPSAETIQ